ncbi:MAG TPA: hypothetical protein VM687_08350 [Stenotrophomonas sp.]|nr:hypothetical protein [Stenotrophomonas sp.]
MNPLPSLLAEAAEWSSSHADADVWRRLHWLDRLDLHLPPEGHQVDAGVQRSHALRAMAESRNAELYASLREAMAAGNPLRLTQLLATYPISDAAPEGLDARDDLIAGVLQLPTPGTTAVALPADAVAYQPTPVRHVLDLLQRTLLGPEDVLVDLGAGLGQVALLAALLSPARTCGIEIEPAYVASARQAAADLGLWRAAFICQDLDQADLAMGTVFYLYTPVRGAAWAQLLERLRAEAARRPIRLCSFGPCTLALRQAPWLRALGPAQPERVAVFEAGP